MEYKVFYRKYRPKNFNELVGQDSIKEILSNSIKINKIAHAYIFTGPRGTGKTSTAKIFAKTLNCIANKSGVSCDECSNCITYNESPDIIEIDAASNNGVEEIRNLRDSVKIAPYSSKYKVYIIDEVHMLSNSAWNAFLKTLEEPPSHVIFILATTEINKIPETVMSRCQRFDFTKIPFNEMFNYLKTICSDENIDIDDNALEEIVNLSNGCLRDALSDLDKVSKLNTKVTIELLEKNLGILSDTKLQTLFYAIQNSNINDINNILDKIINSGVTPINFINSFVNFLLNKLVKGEYANNSQVVFLKDLVYKLNNLTAMFNSYVNPFTLLKVELLSSYNSDVNISREIKYNHESEKNVESSEFIAEDIGNKLENIDSIKTIRVNNSFVDPSKDLKIKFIDLWKKMIDELTVKSNYNLLGYFDNLSIEVVSKNNVIFSFPLGNSAIIFNNNLDIIEKAFNEVNNTSYKFIALSSDEWKLEKKNFIKNKDKNYEYIDESNLDECSKKVKTKEIAEDIFGEDIIEIR